MAIRNGKDPIITSSIFPPVTFLMIYKFMPTGGVSCDSSTMITIAIPNHNSEYPIPAMSGATIGNVITIMVIPSIKHPITKKMKYKRTRSPQSGRPSEDAKSMICLGTSLNSRTLDKISPPKMRKSTIQVTLTVPIRHSQKLFHVSLFIITARTRLPDAPNPAASVGVATPAYIVPKQAIIRRTKLHIPFKASILCLKLNFVSRIGAASGSSRVQTAITSTNNRHRIIPGINPAKNNLPIDCSVNEP